MQYIMYTMRLMRLREGFRIRLLSYKSGSASQVATSIGLALFAELDHGNQSCADSGHLIWIRILDSDSKILKKNLKQVFLKLGAKSVFFLCLSYCTGTVVKQDRIQDP